MNSSENSRVSIPNNVLKIIQGIKEKIGNYSDEDVYAMLKEFDMDPIQTTQRLLYLDTFQEVKSKRDRKKVNVSSRGRSRKQGQWRGSRGGQGNNFLSYRHQGKVNAAESTATILAGIKKNSPALKVAKNSEAVSGTVNSCNGIAPSKVVDFGAASFATILAGNKKSVAPDVAKNCEAISKSSEAVSGTVNSCNGIGPSKVVASVEPNMRSEPNLSVLEEATSRLNKKLEELTVYSPGSVIFPDNFQTPEVGFVFGSFNFSSGQPVKYINNHDDGKCSRSVSDSTRGKNVLSSEPSLSKQSQPSTDQEGDYHDHPQSSSDVPEKLSAAEGIPSSGEVPKYDQLKQVTVLPPRGPESPLVQTVPDDSFAFRQFLLGSQFEAPNSQGVNSLVPPIIGYPQPHNQFSHSLYFPAVYTPPSSHQVLGHSGLTQQFSTRNVYLTPLAAAATSGNKFSIPQSKPRTNSAKFNR